MKPAVYHLATDYARFGLSKAQADAVLNNRFPNRKFGGVQGAPKYIVLHIQDGYTVGSLQWWSIHSASSTVMVQRDGSVLRVIDERHGPWTNGDVNRPTAAGKEVVALGGNANLWTLTIEAEGKPNDNMPKAQLDAIEWQVREWMKQYSIPQENVIRHADLNSVTRSYCPGYYYAQIKARLRGGETPSHATTAPPDDYAPAHIPDWLGEEGLAEGVDRQLGPSLAYACRRKYTVVADSTPRYQYADKKHSAKVGPDLRRGDIFEGEFVFENPDGWWVLTRFGTRVHQDALTPNVRIKP